MLSALPLTDCDFVAVDLETTGCLPGRNSIIEVGAVRVRDGRPIGRFSSLVHPADQMPRAIVQLTGITPEMLTEAPCVADVLAAFRAFAEDAVLVAHNYRFDLGFLDFEAEGLWGAPFARPALDTLAMARQLYPRLERYNLLHLAEWLDAETRPDHRAENDARATAEVFSAMLPELRRRGMDTVGELAAFCGLPDQHELASRLPLTFGVPDAPGVYALKDENGRVLYVGRAKSLRSRVRSHFYPAGDRGHSELGCRVSSVKALETHSLLDAALLERKLIFRNDPPFNASCQRARSIYLLYVDTQSPFPSVKVVTRRRRRGAHIGPFTSRRCATILSEQLTAAYDLRRCANRLDSSLASKECDLRNGECPAPCRRQVDRDEYDARLLKMLGVFNGEVSEGRELLADLQEAAAGDARYEDAIRFRDALRALDRATGVISTLRMAAERDVVLIEQTVASVTVHLIHGGLRAAVLRGTARTVDARLPLAIRRAYFSNRPHVDLLDMTSRQIGELLAVATFIDRDCHTEVPIADEADTLAGVRHALGLIRGEPRRRHAAL